MLFNSFVFLIFAAGFFLLWPLVRRRDYPRWIFICCASFLFYGWWDWRFLFLLLGSGLVDFFSGLAMVRHPARRRLFLALSMGANLGSLAAFKYSGFLAENLDALCGWLGWPTHLRAAIPDFLAVLPVGISFYTFQSMSYTIDVYRGDLKPTRNLLHFFAYISLFPQLVAGPIVRAVSLLPQLTTWRRATREERWDGLRLIAHGFFKKMVIADNLAPIVNAAFGAPAPADSAVYWWVVVSMFAFQIYCDFSGYSDIARGLARWMGLEFTLNFAHPYTSQSLREFWTRWHISLSTWFRDYVYIPLGGSRRGPVRAMLYLWVTLLASAFWHGAAWKFITWGALHAGFLTVERVTGWPEKLARLPGGRYLACLVTLFEVWLAWVFFRARDMAQACTIIGTLFHFDHFQMPCSRTMMIWLGVAAARELYVLLGGEQSRWARAACWRWLEPVQLAALLAACVFLRGPGGAFIYFQF